MGTDSRLQKRIRVAALVAMTLVVVISVTFYFSPYRDSLDVQRGVDWAQSLRALWWTPVAYALLYIFITILGLPVVVLSVAGALIWGWFVGGLIELFVATIAAFPPYYLARAASGTWIERHVQKRAAQFSSKLKAEGFLAIFLIRLVPILPYGILNYAAGLANVRLNHYAIATVIGMIPSIFIFTYFVDAIVAGASSVPAAMTKITIAGVLIAILVIGGRVLAKRWRIVS